MSEQYEYNVCRQDRNGALWDIYDDEAYTTEERAREGVKRWEAELEPDEPDTVVVIRRLRRPEDDWAVVPVQQDRSE
jgi:hypothetical protein